MTEIVNLIELINKLLKLNLDPKLTPKEATLKSLGIDSIDFYNILFELEEMTGCEVSDDDAENIKTLQDLINTFFQSNKEA